MNFLDKFVRLFPDLNTRWLITGEGEMFGDEIAEINVSGSQVMFSDNISQKGKGNIMQKSGASKQLEALQKELEYKTRENELLKEENEKKDKIINKLLDK